MISSSFLARMWKERLHDNVNHVKYFFFRLPLQGYQRIRPTDSYDDDDDTGVRIYCLFLLARRYLFIMICRQYAMHVDLAGWGRVREVFRERASCVPCHEMPSLCGYHCENVTWSHHVFIGAVWCITRKDDNHDLYICVYIYCWTCIASSSVATYVLCCTSLVKECM